jgi:anti-anti-sigma factor
MQETNPSIKYQCRRQTAALTLNGEITVACATEFHRSALRAANETKATEICINLSTAERLDISSIQILLALHRHCEAVQRKFTLKGASASTDKLFRELGLPL